MEQAATRSSRRANPDCAIATPSAASTTRELRIRRRQDYLRVQKNNVRVTSRHFVLLLAQGQRADIGRTGITVSRKIGTAVVRNRARRLVREAMRRLPGFIPQGIDLVVVLRAPPGDMRMQDALAEMQAVAPVVDRRCRALLAGPAERHGEPR